MNLLHGDSLELISEIDNGSIDLLLTDPPYNIAQKNNFTSMGRTGIDFGEWDKNFDELAWIKDIFLKVKKGGTVIIFNAWKNLGDISNELEQAGFQIKDLIRWEKSNPMPRNRDRRYIVDYEFAIVAVKPKAKWTFNRQSDKYDRSELRYPIVGGSEKTKHPTQKPVALMEELILRHSNEGETVFDPFMGSGSTGVAAIRTKRNFIGIEIEQEYFDISVDRINNERVEI